MRSADGVEQATSAASPATSTALFSFVSFLRKSSIRYKTVSFAVVINGL
jgi:hypothetical protein